MPDRHAPSAAAPAPDALDALVAEYQSLLDQLGAKHPDGDKLGYRLLIVRDRIAAAIRDAAPPLSLAAKIGDLDKRLKGKQVAAFQGAAFDALRSVMQPPAENWWWQPRDPANPLWTAIAVLLLTLSLTMITDFARRVLSTDPNETGIVWIASQAVLAVAATSAFSDSGRQWFETLLRRRVRPRFLPPWKLAAALGLFLVVCLLRKFAPGIIAQDYNNVAFHTHHSTAELQGYKLAIAFDPEMVQAHFNLGIAYEDAYQYDKAIDEYHTIIGIDPTHAPAYANLARLLILQNQPLNALRIADDGSKLSNVDSQTAATIRKNLAWAESELGYYRQAESDAKLALQSTKVTAAAYCVLGKIYNQTHKPGEAQAAWSNFTAAIHDPAMRPSIIEPDCVRLAEASQ